MKLTQAKISEEANKQKKRKFIGRHSKSKEVNAPEKSEAKTLKERKNKDRRANKIK